MSTQEEGHLHSHMHVHELTILWPSIDYRCKPLIQEIKKKKTRIQKMPLQASNSRSECIWACFPWNAATCNPEISGISQLEISGISLK
jgi:hypothetical protein